jgi:hypothetical protein
MEDSLWESNFRDRRDRVLIEYFFIESFHQLSISSEGSKQTLIKLK